MFETRTFEFAGLKAEVRLNTTDVDAHSAASDHPSMFDIRRGG